VRRTYRRGRSCCVPSWGCSSSWMMPRSPASSPPCSQPSTPWCVTARTWDLGRPWPSGYTDWDRCMPCVLAWSRWTSLHPPWSQPSTPWCVTARTWGLGRPWPSGYTDWDSCMPCVLAWSRWTSLHPPCSQWPQVKIKYKLEFNLRPKKIILCLGQQS